MLYLIVIIIVIISLFVLFHIKPWFF